MTKQELSIIQAIALQLLSLCSTADLDNQKFEASAEKTKNYFQTVFEQNQLEYKNSSQEKNCALANQKENSQVLLELKGVSITSKPRKDGRFQGYLILKGEKRYVYGKSREEITEKIQRLVKKGYFPKKKETKTEFSVPTTFNAFAIYYFENFRKRKVVESTLKADYYRYNKHIKPVFMEQKLKSIVPIQVQQIIDKLEREKKGKTKDEVVSLLNGIFKMAIRHNVMKNNPLDVIYHEQHEREVGIALTVQEIKVLQETYKGTKYLDSIMTYLYTGLRPSELATARIDGNFIVAENQKQKDKKAKKIHYKKIPIVKALLPYIKNGIVFSPLEYLRTKIQSAVGHTIKDLRKTFYSQCEKCNMNEYAIKIIVGHSLGKLGNTYTGFNDEFLIDEMKKFHYEFEVDTKFDTH